MLQALLVFVGGGLGSVARWLVSRLAVAALGAAFPYGTLAVNAVGSFLIMLILELSLKASSFSPELRLFLTTGMMGGFTTYSTFNYESIKLFQQGAPLLGALNLALTVALCLAGGGLALVVARAVTAP